MQHYGRIKPGRIENHLGWFVISIPLKQDDWSLEDSNLLKVFFWTSPFNMMVPHSLDVTLVKFSFFDTGLYKLGSMRYMAEKTSTNVYRSVWVYLCILILFCIFHFYLKVDYITIIQPLPGSMQPRTYDGGAPSCCSRRESFFRCRCCCRLFFCCCCCCCVTQLKLYTFDKLSSLIFCCVWVC